MNAETAPAPQNQESAPAGGEDVASKFARLQNETEFAGFHIDKTDLERHDPPVATRPVKYYRLDENGDKVYVEHEDTLKQDWSQTETLGAFTDLHDDGDQAVYKVPLEDMHTGPIKVAIDGSEYPVDSKGNVILPEEAINPALRDTMNAVAEIGERHARLWDALTYPTTPTPPPTPPTTLPPSRIKLEFPVHDDGEFVPRVDDIEPFDARPKTSPPKAE